MNHKHADEEENEEHNIGFQEEEPLHVHLPMPFNEVQNLNNVLPLTSTPASSSSTRSRLPGVRPRGLLPIELEQTTARSSATSSRIKTAMQNREKEQSLFLTAPPDYSDSD